MKFYEHFDEMLGKHFTSENEKIRYLKTIGLIKVHGKYTERYNTRTKTLMTRQTAINRYGPTCLPFWDIDNNPMRKRYLEEENKTA